MSLVCYVWITYITTQCHAGRSAALPPCFSAKAASFRTHRMLIGLVFSATASRTCPDWLRAGLCADEMQIQSGTGKRLTPRSEMAIHLQRNGHRSSYDESAYLPKQNLKYSQILSLFSPPTSAHFLPLSVWAEVCSAELWRLQNPSQVCLWLLLCMENASNTSETLTLKRRGHVCTDLNVSRLVGVVWQISTGRRAHRNPLLGRKQEESRRLIVKVSERRLWTHRWCFRGTPNTVRRIILVIVHDKVWRHAQRTYLFSSAVTLVWLNGEMVSDGAVLVRGLSVRVCLCVSSDGDIHILECVSLYNNVVIYRPVENCSFIHNIAQSSVRVPVYSVTSKSAQTIIVRLLVWSSPRVNVS